MTLGKVQSGPRPPAMGKTRSGRNSAVYELARALKAGEWVTWEVSDRCGGVNEGLVTRRVLAMMSSLRTGLRRNSIAADVERSGPTQLTIFHTAAPAPARPALGTDHAPGPQRFSAPAPTPARLQKQAELERSESAREAHAPERASHPRKVTTDAVAGWVDRALAMELDTRLEVRGLTDDQRKRLRFRLAYGPAADVKAKGPYRVLFVGGDVVRIEWGSPPMAAERPEELGPATPWSQPGRLKPPQVDPALRRLL